MAELKYKVTTIVPAEYLHQVIENIHNFKGMTYKVEIYDENECKEKKPVMRGNNE